MSYTTPNLPIIRLSSGRAELKINTNAQLSINCDSDVLRR